MSGIYGICEPGVQLQADELEAMSSAVLLEEDRRELPLGSNGALMGAAHRGKVPQMGVKHGVLVAMDADLSNYAALLAEHEKASDEGVGSVGELVAVLYARYGLTFVEKLEGAFSLALWDPQQQRLVLAIDRFGFKALVLVTGNRQNAIFVAPWCDCLCGTLGRN